MRTKDTMTAVAFAALLAGAGVAAAQSAPPAPPPGMHGRHAPLTAEQASQRLATRLDALRAALYLQPTQTAAWDAFAGTLQSNLQARRKLREARPAAADREALADYRVALLKFNAQAADQANQARKALVATFSPEQKAALDGFRARPGAQRREGRGPGRAQRGCA